MKNKIFRFSSLIFIIASLISFVYFIWPTPWNNVKISKVPYRWAAYETVEEKTNRFSGDQCRIAVQDLDRVYANGDCWTAPSTIILLMYSFITLLWVLSFNIEHKKNITNMMLLQTAKKSDFYLKHFSRVTILFVVGVFTIYLLFSALYIFSFQ